MRRMPAILLLAVTVAALLPAGSDDPARAGWAHTSYATVTVSSGTLDAVPQVSCGASSGLLAGNIPISWTPAATGGQALTPQSYTLSWSGTAGSGSTTVTGTSSAVTGATLTLLGTSTVRVTANLNGWTSPVSLQTRTITTVVGLGGAILLWTCG